MKELTLEDLESIDGGGKNSAVVNGVLGYSLICVGMCVSGPVGWAVIAGGGYCMYNGFKDKYGR